MEDIICPECGRPNLIEAEKCWYCQTSLQDIKSSETESPSAEPIDGNIRNDNEEIPSSTKETKQEIPEWLKRVRELREADQPPEEDDPSWQQQNLFKTENNVHKRKKLDEKKPPSRKEIARKELNSKKKNDNPAELPEENPYVFQGKNNADTQEKPETGPTDQEDDAFSHDLPEGFTKL